jgi:hypothetical protein
MWPDGNLNIPPKSSLIQIQKMSNRKQELLNARLLRTGYTRGLTPICIVLLAVVCRLSAQNPQIDTKSGSRFPTVIFTSVLWTADPSYYSLAIDSSGTATYQSAPDSIEHTGVHYTVEFQVSDRTRRTAFNVTRELDYFREPMGEALTSARNSSVRTLAYHDSQLHTQVTYGASPDSEIEELTSIFEGISETLEFGRRLTYFHEHDRSALDGELDRLQKSVDRRILRELPVIVPVLRSIASDNRVESSARDKAEALLNRMSRPRSTENASQ